MLEATLPQKPPSLTRLSLLRHSLPNRLIGQIMPFIEQGFPITELISFGAIHFTSLYQQERYTNPLKNKHRPITLLTPKSYIR